MTRIVRALVLSDIHASTNDGDSWLKVGGIDNSYIDPFRALLDSIEKELIPKQIDYLICCGDIGNKSIPASIDYGWKRIHDVARKLNGNLKVITTAGNHDIDSRHQHNDFDAKGLLQSLDPPFPFDDEATNNDYWANHFTVISENDLRFLVLNSSAYHGTSDTLGTPEYNHGRIARRTISRIKARLNNMEPPLLNILICHHHPHRHGDLIAEDDYSAMKDGDQLIDALSTGEYGRWLIVHGHKHQPRICQAAGAAVSPIVFGAGSFSARLHPAVSQVATNQCYLFEFNLKEMKEIKLDLCGEVRAFDWTATFGWQPAGTTSPIPARTGFGYALQKSSDAEEVLRFVKDSGQPWVTWSETLDHIPRLRYLLPQDKNYLINHLRQNHGLTIAFDVDANDQHLALRRDA